MGKIWEIKLPLKDEDIHKLKCGDEVWLTGVMYTARDAAHKRFMCLLEEKQPLPIPIESAVIYYVGPCPAKPGEAIGSAGPTTSGRMDSYTTELLDKGLKGMIGKGDRSSEVIESMKKNKAVYFAAVGGAGALLASHIRRAEPIAFCDLGPEAVYRLEVERFPVFVAVDAFGENVYDRK